MSERFVGKFLATVTDNNDPKHLSRLKVKVPEVFGEVATGWCLPCASYAGDKVGIAMVPPNGSLVFVEWPAGDTTRVAIWSGGLWVDGKGVPGADPEAIVLATPKGHRIEVHDTASDKAIKVTAQSGAVIVLDDKGISLTFGSSKIEMTKSAVTINGGALKVT